MTTPTETPWYRRCNSCGDLLLHRCQRGAAHELTKDERIAALEGELAAAREAVKRHEWNGFCRELEQLSMTRELETAGQEMVRLATELAASQAEAARLRAELALCGMYHSSNPDRYALAAEALRDTRPSNVAGNPVTGR